MKCPDKNYSLSEDDKPVKELKVRFMMKRYFYLDRKVDKFLYLPFSSKLREIHSKKKSDIQYYSGGICRIRE